jgi:hypothetical protein
MRDQADAATGDSSHNALAPESRRSQCSGDRMGRIIKGQVIASTYVDSSGERLTVEQLEGFLSSMPPVSLMNQQHDRSLPPVARGTNPRLETLPDGNHVIRLDLEVLDEEAFSRGGGASIAFATPHAYSLRPTDPPEIVLSVVESQVSAEWIRALLVSVGGSVVFVVQFRKEKAATPAAIATLKFATKALASKFLGESAMAAFRKLREGCRELLRGEPNGTPEARLHISYPAENSWGQFEVLIEISEEDLRDGRKIEIASVQKYIDEVVGQSEVARVCVKRGSGSKPWHIGFFVTRSGDVITL